MADFVRTLRPVDSTPFERADGSKVSVAHTGSLQLRAGYAAGLVWTEEYEPMPQEDPDFWAFWEYLQHLKRTREIVEFALGDIWGRQALLGSAAGTILVNGADQVGNTLTTDGGSGTLLPGDILRVDGMNHSLVVIASASLPGDIEVAPGILSGGSPANDAEVFYGTDASLRVIVDECVRPTVRGDTQAYIGIRVTYREAP